MTQVNEKIYYAHGLAILILAKMSIFLKGNYRSNTILIKIPIAFFTALDQII